MTIHKGERFICIDMEGNAKIYIYKQKLAEHVILYNVLTGKKVFAHKHMFLSGKKVIKIDGRDILDFKRLIKQEDIKNIKIKSCPKCGSDKVYVSEYEHTAGLRYGVICMDCLCSQYTGILQTIGLAVEEWNERKES